MLILNKFLSVVDIAHGGTGNTSGIAVNVSASSNSTLTTLTLLSLPASQLTGTLPSGSFPALTGDVTTSAGSVATTLATVNGNVGSFGSSTSIPSFTVNAKGLITAASGNVVIAPAGTLSGSTLAANVLSSSLTSVGTITTGVWNGTTIAIANGGTGQTTQQAALNALAGSVTSGQYLRGNGTNVLMSAIQAGDVPTLNQNTTGTASNITASSNSTLTTLSALSLPGAQVTGNIAGNAANITATSNSTLTTLSALSLPTTQLTGTLQAAQEPAHTGDVTNSAGSLALSLVATTNSTLTTLSALTSASALATVGTITSGTWSATTIAVNKGGTGQTSYTDGQLLIGNSSGNTLSKASLTAGANITITPGNGSITIAASSTAIPAYTYVSQSSTLNPAAIGTYYTLSSTSFTVTLPTAAGVAGQSIRFMHNGTNFSQVYTFNTTGGQTILNRGITYTSGQVAAYTTGEFFEYTSDGANWQVSEHQCDTGWISVGSFANFYTYTVTSANATTATTYVPAYVFTVTSANATVGATYTNNGHTYTVAATIAAQTTLVMTGNADPTASGTLTKSGGTGDATITFSAFAGNPNTSTFTVAKTIAAQTTLATQSDSATPNASGRLVKTGAGAGDAVIVYSAVSGSANDIQSTTTEPVWFGTPTNNSMMVKRKGNMAQYWMNYYQATAGAVAGSGDFLFPIKMSGQTFDSGVFTYYTGGTAQTQQGDKPAEASQVWPGLVTGYGSVNGTNWYTIQSATPYDSTHYRIYARVAGVVESIAIGSTNQSGTAILNFNFQFELPITGWLP